MKLNSLNWIMAGVLFLCMCIAVVPVSAACGELVLDAYPLDLQSSWTFNVDAGAPGGSADIWWHAITLPDGVQMERYNGATLVNLGSVDFNSITYNDLLGYSYSTAPIPFANIIAGDVFAVHTDQGNVAKIKVLDKQLHEGTHFDLVLWEVLYSCGPDPTITSIYPNTGVNTGVRSITNLAGTGFVGHPGVYLKKTGQPNIYATNVVVVSPTQITCNFDLTGKPGGMWDLVIVYPNGQQVTQTDAFHVMFEFSPVFGSITPDHGPTAGGTPVTIAGTNFVDGVQVYIAGMPAGSVTWVDSTTITAVTYAKPAGPTFIQITNPDLQSDWVDNAFTYEAPTTGSISVTSTPSSAEIWIDEEDTGHQTPYTVNGITPGIHTVRVSFPGYYDAIRFDVNVVSGETTNLNLPMSHLPPQFGSISPTSGSTLGGTAVTITGSDFYGVSSVTFGGTAASSYSVVNANTITATTPAHAAGLVDVAITTPGGTNTGYNRYTYVAPVSALHLRKVVVNSNGGTRVATDWTLSAAGPTPISGAGSVDSGAGFTAGIYTLSESGPAGYQANPWSCVGGTQVNNQITVAAGQDVTCTITNWNLIPALTLIKQVVNDGGGTALATDWTLTAAGPTPLSGTTPVNSGPGFSAGIYTLSESGPGGYTAGAWNCVGGTQNTNTITVGLGESATCTITNTYIPPPVYHIHNTNIPKDYATIEDAISEASPMDTIIVDSGTYVPFIVDKPLKIIGEDIGSGLPVVQMASNGNAVWLKPGSDGSTIEGFNVISSVPQSGVGVYIDSDNNKIISVAVNNFLTGIYIDQQDSNRISFCTASGNINGIWTYGESQYTVIEGCTLTNGVSTSSGIIFGSGAHSGFIWYSEISGMTNGLMMGDGDPGYTMNNGISENNIHDNDIGISTNGAGNYFSTNTIVDNSIGIKIYTTYGGGNEIYNNYFDNTENVNPVPSYWNTWNIPISQHASKNIVQGPKWAGNYWAGFTCNDLNNDWFCDDPYTINVDNIDNYPLKTGYVEPNDHIQVTFPFGWETFYQGTSQMITWDYTGDTGSTVKITLLKSEIEVETISAGTSIGSGGQGSFPWVISPTLTPGDDYSIVVRSTTKPVEGRTEPSITIAAPSGRPEAIDNGETYLDPTKDVEELLVSDDDVDPGTPIKLINGQTIPSPGDGSYWVEFINLAKNDNWGHPAKLIFHATGKPDVVYDVDFPPSDENIVKFLHEGGKVPNYEGRTSIEIAPDPDFACTPNADHNYAVLIAGGTDSTQNYARYYSDIKFLYNTLRGPNYGYPANHIKVVMSDGTDPAVDQKTTASTINSDPKLDGTNSVDIKRATKVNVTSAIHDWSPALTSADTLFIFTTGHGQKTTTTTDNTNDVRLLLWGTTENITDTELVAALPTASPTNPKVLMMMEQCYAGGFKDEFIPSSGSNIRVLATAARGDQVSHSNEYSYYYITAMAGKDSAGVLVNADKTPEDGQISMREAHTYANNLDPSRIAGTETPYLFEWTTNPAAGSINYASTCAASKSITVTIPSGEWENNTVKKIQWATSGFSTTPTLKIELMNANGWQADISASVPGDATSGSTGVNWRVPETLPGGSGSGYYVLISTISTQQGVYGKSATFSTKNVRSQWPGALKVTSSPSGATIILRDFQYNPVKISGVVVPDTITTEKNWTSIDPAKYWVKAVKTCYLDVSFAQKQVNPNTTTQAPFTLVSVTNCANPGPIGSIAITSLPKEGFRVWLKGGTLGSAFVDMGYETPVIQDLEIGDYEVKLEAPGFESQQQSVTVNPGEQENVDFVLTPIVDWYTFRGFSEPIDMNGVVNNAKAGQAIPAKWHLTNWYGVVSDPTAFTTVMSYNVNCGSYTGNIEEAIEEYAAGGSDLQYKGNGDWQYNWKTPKTYAGTCRNMYVQFKSGQKSPEVRFKFK
jgi:parallel beta-helix repeat protein